MLRSWTMALVALALLSPALVHAQSPDMGVPDIMKPEPWLPPKYKSPRGLPQHVQPVRPMRVPRARAQVPSTLYVPQTGMTLPNMPTLSPSGPGGRETYQDRAARCAHQAGSAGEAGGDRTGYIGTCINQ